MARFRATIRRMKLKKIISGGQTGADQGALGACLLRRFPYGGWIPKGRRTEKGKVPARYRTLREHRSRHYPPRTEANVKASDVTAVFTYGPPDGGSLLTIAFAKQHRKPCLKVDLDQPFDATVARIIRWLKRRCPDNGILNVAGSRRSKAPDIHRAVKSVMAEVLLRIHGPRPPRARRPKGQTG